MGIAQNWVPFQLSPHSEYWGYKDSATSRVFIYWHFQEAKPFGKNGLALVKYNDRYGYMNKKGEIIIPIYLKEPPVFEGEDTLMINKSNRTMLLKENGKYAEYDNGLRYLKDIQEIEKREKLIVRQFEYPKDSALVAELLMEDQKNEARKPRLHEEVRAVKKLRVNQIGIFFTLNKEQESWNPNAVYWPSSNVGLQLRHYLKRDLLNSSLHIGVETSLQRNRVWTDSVRITATQLSLGLVQRLKIDNNISFVFAISPIINTRTKLAGINSDDVPNNAEPIRGFNAIYDLGIEIEGEKTYVGFGYRKIPSKFYLDNRYRYGSFKEGFYSLRVGLCFN